MIEPILPARRPSHRTWPVRLVPALVLCASFFASAPCLAQQRTRLVNRETPLADASYGPSVVALVISADGSRSVSVVRDGGQFAVFDGYPGVSYDELAPGMPLLSGDGDHCAYVARRKTPGYSTNRWFVVFDGAESIPFPYVNTDSPVLSPDGSRLAAVVEGSDGKDARLFIAPSARPTTAPVDEPVSQPVGNWWELKPPKKPQGDVPKLAAVPGPLFDDIDSTSLCFSPDGRHLAYAARHGRNWRVVLDGLDTGGPYDAVGRPRFCGLGTLLGYVARRQGKSVVVTVPMGVAGAVGAEGRAHDSILEQSLTFSFDGRHLAYVEGKPGAMSVYLDGAEIKPAAAPPAGAVAPFERVAAGSLTFCPDGSRLAFAAFRGGEWFVVLDGVEGPHCLGVAPTSLAFSLNGKRFAYVAEGLVADVNQRAARVGRCVVVDGVPQAFYDRIAAPPAFSPDGRRCAYVAERGGRSFIVIDQMEGKAYGCLRGRPMLSIDGSRCAITAVADDPDHRFHAVEEVPRNPSDPSAGARLIFDHSTDFLRLTNEQRMKPVKLLLVEERVAPE